MKSIIRNFLAKLAAGRTDDGIMITLPDPKKINFQEAMMQDLLMRNGVDPNAITSEEMLKSILNQIDMASKQTAPSGIRGTRSAQILDMEGQTIPQGSQIMGGKAVDTDAAIKARLEKNNKKGIENIREKNKNYKLNLFKNLDDKKKLNNDEYEDFLEEIGGEDRLEAYDFDGTAGSAKKILKDDVEYEEFMFEQYKSGKLDPEQPKSNKPITSLDNRINEEFQKGMKEGKFNNVRLKDGRRIKTEDDFREYIDELNEDNNFDFAQGGRVGFKDGPNMGRRNFLKIMGGLAAIPIVGKFFKVAKVGKTVSKVPVIKTADVAGKPEWFDALVNKVILEGDDVTKKFATQERQVVHMKKIDDDTSVTVTQDLNDGSIMVDVDDPIRNVMGESGQDTSVQMMLKKGQADETTKGTPPDEFSFTENDMRNYMDGPDDYTTEFVENTVNKMSDLTSDLGKIKSYATGKGPTMKQIVESKKRKDMVKFAEENPSEYAANRGPDFDPDYDDYASGGIARMLGE